MFTIIKSYAANRYRILKRNENFLKAVRYEN